MTRIGERVGALVREGSLKHEGSPVSMCLWLGSRLPESLGKGMEGKVYMCAQMLAMS